MDKQKKDVMDFVTEQSAKGKAITETLREIGIKRSTYYSWLKTPQKKRTDLPRAAMLTPDEKKAIEDAKEEHPLMRHGQIQGILRMKGLYLSQTGFLQASARPPPTNPRKP